MRRVAVALGRSLRQLRCRGLHEACVASCTSRHVNASSKTCRSMVVRWASTAKGASKAQDKLVRTNIGVFGAMNTGKSTLMNVLTQQETSIVDKHAGVTTDVKPAVMEFHKLGPVKLMDTPGIDESGILGVKKKAKAFTALKQVDIAVIVVDPFHRPSIDSAKELLEECLRQTKKQKVNKEIVVVYNLFADKTKGVQINAVLESIEKELGIDTIKKRKAKNVHTISIDLHHGAARNRVIRMVEENYMGGQFSSDKTKRTVSLLPWDIAKLVPDSQVLLNIPMDDETPSQRLLRPQTMVVEGLLRKYVNVYSYRMDLGKGRSKNPLDRQAEELRFRNQLSMLKSGPSSFPLLITDSQAMDLIHPWTLDPHTKEPLVPITTFSIVMINFMSGGRLPMFIKGLHTFLNLKEGDRVLICEACNHDRIQDDIGTVQIPNKIRALYGDKVGIDHAFGREYETKDFSKYKLAIHCGGCMLEAQNMRARLADIEATSVPITNYGLLLSYFQSPFAVQRVLKPWGLTVDIPSLGSHQQSVPPVASKPGCHACQQLPIH